jgi:hypothetical protein
MIACIPLPFLGGTVGHTCTFYIDLAHLLYKKCVSNIDKPKKVFGFDEDGDISVQRSKYSKVSLTIFNLWHRLYNLGCRKYMWWRRIFIVMVLSRRIDRLGVLSRSRRIGRLGVLNNAA